MHLIKTILLSLCAAASLVSFTLAGTPTCSDSCDARCQSKLVPSTKTDLKLSNINSDRILLSGGAPGSFHYDVSIFYKSGTTTLSAPAAPHGPYVFAIDWDQAGVHRYIINTKYDTECTLTIPGGAKIKAAAAYYVPNL